MKKNKQSCREIGAPCTIMHAMRLPEEKREKGDEKIFKEILTDNFPNRMKSINLLIQKN